MSLRACAGVGIALLVSAHDDYPDLTFPAGEGALA
jgi:hypothetical protein